MCVFGVDFKEVRVAFMHDHISPAVGEGAGFDGYAGLYGLFGFNGLLKAILYCQGLPVIGKIDEPVLKAVMGCGECPIFGVNHRPAPGLILLKMKPGSFAGLVNKKLLC